jgi:hypothetical protein
VRGWTKLRSSRTSRPLSCPVVKGHVIVSCCVGGGCLVRISPSGAGRSRSQVLARKLLPSRARGQRLRPLAAPGARRVRHCLRGRACSSA